MAVWLGIDYGLERCGLAVSDSGENLVFPVATLRLSQCRTRDAFLSKIVATAQNHNAAAIVMGLPLLENGLETLTCAQVRNAAKRIKRRLFLPMYFMPEFLSSYEAELDLREAGRHGKKLKAVLDQAAACRILESFLSQPPERRMPA